MGEHGRPYWLHQVAEYIVGFILLLAVSRVGWWRPSLLWVRGGRKARTRVLLVKRV